MLQVLLVERAKAIRRTPDAGSIAHGVRVVISNMGERVHELVADVSGVECSGPDAHYGLAATAERSQTIQPRAQLSHAEDDSALRCSPAGLSAGDLSAYGSKRHPGLPVILDLCGHARVSACGVVDEDRALLGTPAEREQSQDQEQDRSAHARSMTRRVGELRA